MNGVRRDPAAATLVVTGLVVDETSWGRALRRQHGKQGRAVAAVTSTQHGRQFSVRC